MRSQKMPSRLQHRQGCCCLPSSFWVQKQHYGAQPLPSCDELGCCPFARWRLPLL